MPVPNAKTPEESPKCRPQTIAKSLCQMSGPHLVATTPLEARTYTSIIPDSLPRSSTVRVSFLQTGGCFLTTLEGLLTNVYSWPSAPRKTEERSSLSTSAQSWLTKLELRKGVGFRRGRIAQGMPRNWPSAAWSDAERWGDWRCFLHVSVASA